MKKTIWAPVCISAAILFAACGGGEEKKTEEKSEETPVVVDDSMVAPTAGKGKELIAAQDCKTCHQEDAKLIGPSYNEIAAKYENNDENIATLAGKVIKGGAGNWGEIPMAPHPAIPEEDAKEMVKYILSVGK
ncbi:c-type cytochrome [Chitinophaga sp. XS-30]|uniref:c-type cytochrome n=1 Tax=Chitinophaga sp. XS-30 TaxID=2604421 RepID=UPI0011DCAFF7|nr:c-type cytochrome [Chitinophaga sp. XS-30]QEH43872.1 c-type cytochrome [Chitinophaga sp. XS-30]